MSLSYSERKELMEEERQLVKAITDQALRHAPPSQTEIEQAKRWVDQLEIVRSKLGIVLTPSGRLNKQPEKDELQEEVNLQQPVRDKYKVKRVPLADPNAWQKKADADPEPAGAA